MNYDHYIALDWSQNNMAIARLTKEGKNPVVIDVKSSVKELQIYLENLKGSKIMTLEESDTSQWLYTELLDYVDKLIVCDPSRNHLLKEGGKTDKIDAIKLVKLLKSDLLKPVYHSGDVYIYLRGLVSGYTDLIKAYVRLVNQNKAIKRRMGGTLDDNNKFVSDGIIKNLELLKEERERYEAEFKRLCKKDKKIRQLTAVPGIGVINAVKIVARVVDARRFENKGKFWSYCGLIKLKRISGGKVYGYKNPKYCREMKSVFKNAAITALNSENIFKEYYKELLNKNRPSYNARNAVARKIASTVLYMMRNEQEYQTNYKEEGRTKKAA